MNIETMVEATVTAEREALDRLGEEIALLSAHISVATARLLEKIRDFDARTDGPRRAPGRAPSGCRGA
jgi:hypothetical protein